MSERPVKVKLAKPTREQEQAWREAMRAAATAPPAFPRRCPECGADG